MSVETEGWPGSKNFTAEAAAPKPAALIAVARKILHAIYGMFRWDRPYDGTRVFPLVYLAAKPIGQLSSAHNHA